MSRDPLAGLDAAAFNEAMTEPTGHTKAAAMIDDYVHERILESQFTDKLLPAKQIQNSDLMATEVDDMPKVLDFWEIDAVESVMTSTPLGVTQYEIAADRTVTHLNRDVTPSYVVHVDRLRTYPTGMDVRAMVGNRVIQHRNQLIDRKYVTGVQTLLGGAAETQIPRLGNAKMWRTMGEPLTRSSWVAGQNIIRGHELGYAPTMALMNDVTLAEFGKWDRNEVGDDMAGDFVRDGVTVSKLGGLDIVTTIKRTLVPDGRIHFFMNRPEFTGRHYELESLRMHVDRLPFKATFFSAALSGMRLHNAGAYAIADYTISN